MLRVSEIAINSRTDECRHALNYEDVTFSKGNVRTELHVKMCSSKTVQKHNSVTLIIQRHADLNICPIQFWKNNGTELEYEESLRRKKLFLLKLKQAADVGKKLSFDGSRLIYENQRSREASEIINGETLTLRGFTHTYDEITKIYFNDIISNEYTVVAAQCIESLCFDHSHGIHIFVEVELATDFQTYDDHATLLRSNMHKKHGVVVPEIIFMEENTLSTYNYKNCSLSAVHKFHIRDDYFSKKLGDKVLYVSRELEESYTDIFNPDTIDCNDLIY
ncbi:unnamed protein product [Mytilus coruscus]|uniref:Uncharacterized protein n=1 Tax=Mytilus coruscus TaxID=42192 RepID=A0A6J8EYW1_MYTCO|nr:unnamed protein product [Mytilus coruscus]